MRNRKCCFTINMIAAAVVTCFVLPAYADTIDATKIAWGYKGNTSPEYWSQLSPEFAVCSTGKTQSPIDVPSKTAKASNKLTLHYQSAPMRIIDDGSTELTIGKTTIITKDGHGVQLNFHSDTKETITLEGKDYRLLQFHIHTPSESTLNGKQFPLEIHFVHQGDDGEVAVIGVLANEGSQNRIIDKIITNLPSEEDKEVTIQGESINPVNLLPKNQQYYRFAGSLTTPPCTEGLKWVLMPNPITVSSAQVSKLRAASGGSNARPVQSLNNRQISFTSTK